MHKTAFTIRNGKISSFMTVEWPDTIDNSAVRILAELRKESPWETIGAIFPTAVTEFCEAIIMMRLRARYNMEDGPFVLTTDAPVEADEVLGLFKDHGVNIPTIQKLMRISNTKRSSELWDLESDEEIK